MNHKTQLNEQVDLFVAYKFIKILTQDFDKTDAFKKGIIDKNGKILKKRRDLKGDERTSYTIFHTLVWNLKKILMKVPGLKSKLGNYATALYLLKESYNKEHKSGGETLLESILVRLGEEENDVNVLFENNFDNQLLSQGVYVATHEIVTPSFETIDEGAVILVGNKKEPLDEIKGVPLYSAVHLDSGEEIIVSKASLEHIHEDVSTAPEVVAGMAVFDVNTIPTEMMSGHKHYERWNTDKFESIDDDVKSAIRKYSYRNKDKVIAVREPHGAITPFKRGRGRK